MEGIKKCLTKYFLSFVPSVTSYERKLTAGKDIYDNRIIIIIYCRVGVRSFGVVRSEAELNQLAYELYEQDEVELVYRSVECVHL